MVTVRLLADKSSRYLAGSAYRVVTPGNNSANPQQVGWPASANKVHAMFELTIKLKLSYKQLVQIIVLLLMLFLS